MCRISDDFFIKKVFQMNFEVPSALSFEIEVAPQTIHLMLLIIVGWCSQFFKKICLLFDCLPLFTL